MEHETQEKTTFYRSLMRRRVYIPCQKQEDGNLNLELLVSRTGEKMLPAFFCRESQIGSFDAQSLVEFAFPTLRNIFIELPKEISGIVIEPFTENIILDRGALAAYDSATQGMTVQKREHSRNTTYRKVDILPSGLKNTFESSLSEQIGVNAVWALLAQDENEKIPHLTFVIDYFGSKFDLFPQLAEVLKPFMRPGQSFELIDREPRMKPFLNDETCVYRRKSSVQ